MAYTTINKSTDYFNTKLYTGNGGYSNAQTGVGFQPDFTWIKVRNYDSSHALFDAVRGGTKRLISNATDAEATYSGGIQSFDTDGFTVGNGGAVNDNGYNFASWNWKANGSGSSNTDGSITSTVSANTTAGFSIVSWTGSNANATIGHGLGASPKMIIFKNRDATTSWMVYHASQGATKYLRLNNGNAVGTGSTPFNDTEPTSSVFSVGANGDTNGSSQSMIAYCFAEKIGHSKFGSYTGNGNADGTFIYTGFKPAMVILKSTSLAEHWWIYDNKRNPSNLVTKRLLPSLNSAEADYANADQMNLDFLSNGFKFRAYDGAVNGSGQTYIFMAFGQSLVGSNNVPCTAR